MKEIEIKIDDISKQFINAISIVKNPAIESKFLKFSKDNKNIINFKIDNKEKRIITGPIMIPEKRIGRIDKDTNELYYCYFSKETIEQFVEDYMINRRNSNTTFEHDSLVEGCTLIENWIVSDEQFDKSKKLGINVPVGTWMGTMKVNNDKVWEIIKNDGVEGFSVELKLDDTILNKYDYNKLFKKIIDNNDLSNDDKNMILSKFYKEFEEIKNKNKS
jgi:hypothetical protein